MCHGDCACIRAGEEHDLKIALVEIGIPADAVAQCVDRTVAGDAHAPRRKDHCARQARRVHMIRPPVEQVQVLQPSSDLKVSPANFGVPL